MRKIPYPVHTTIVDDSEERAVLEVLRSGHLSGFSARAGERFLGGPKVKELEGKFAEAFGTRHAVSFNSATSALHGAVAAVGIGPGDEVITSPASMSATASAVLMQNAVPVFADIEDRTFGLDPASVEGRITPRTRAILTVNLFGHPSRLDVLEAIAKKHGLFLLEDNSQSPGASLKGRLAGTIGSIGIQSLNYHKGIQTGEGGIALTGDADLALRLQMTRNHGEVVAADLGQDEWVNQLGWNYRLTELQAAIGIPQLAKLGTLNGIRRRLASHLHEGLADYDFITSPVVEPGCTHSFYLFPMRYHEDRIGLPRSLFVKAMQAEGISIGGGYVRPIYWEPMYQRRLVYGRSGCPFTCGHYRGSVSYERGLCPIAERLHEKELLTTDICKYPNSEKEVEEFLAALKKVTAHLSSLRKVAP